VLDREASVALSSQVVNRQDARPADELPGSTRDDPRLAAALPDRVLNGDSRLLAEVGAEVLVKTARLWGGPRVLRHRREVPHPRG
jgi:hypothetical protein